MSAYVQNDFSFLSRRTTAVVLIVGLHALIIYGFTAGLMRKVIDVVAPPIVAVVQPYKAKPIDPPPALSPPQFRQPQIKVGPTEVKIDVDKVGLQEMTTEVVEEHPQPGPNPPPVIVNRVLGGPGKAFPNTDDYYPPTEIRLGRKGIATVQVCTDEKGRLTAVPTLAQTSGSAGLDAGALRLANAGSGHYRATTENGQPVSSCYPFRIKFDFKN